MSFTKHFALSFILLNQLILTGRWWDKTVGALQEDRDVPKYARTKLRSSEILRFVFEVLHRPSELYTESNVKAKNRVVQKNFKRSLLSKGLTLPLCSPWDSCTDRCEERPRGLPYTCNCDSMCPIFSDCCVDFEKHCKVNMSIFDRVKVPPKCKDQFPIPWPTYVISDCPYSFKNKSIRQQCTHGQCKHGHAQICEDKAHAYCDKRVLHSSEMRNLAAVLPETMDGSYTSSTHEKYEPFIPEGSVTKDYEKCVTEYKQKCVADSPDCEMARNVSTLVASISGLIYSNAACALCSGETKLKPIDLSVLIAGLPLSEKRQQKNRSSNLDGKIPLRACFPAIDTCPSTDMFVNNKNVAALCAKYSGHIVADVQDGDQETKLLFKNVYCALCNGVKQRKVSCPSWVMPPNKGMSVLSMYHSVAENVVPDYGEVHAIQAASGDLPAPFSILLNFGLDGRERMMFSSEGEEEMRRQQTLCDMGHIWDPFSKVCRKLFCSTDFILVDFRCVQKPEDNESNKTAEENKGNIENDYYVHISLTFEVGFFDLLRFYGEPPKNLENVIRDSLATEFEISPQRIRNVKINISLGNFKSENETLRFIDDMDDHHPIIFIAELDLYENENISSTERTVDTIVSILTTSVSGKGFKMTIENMNSRIFEFHHTVDPSSSWCDAEKNGEQIEYWNSDFNLLLSEDDTSTDSWVRAVYINKTQKTYDKGEFVANILFQGYQFSGKLMNVSGVVFVCEFPNKLNSSCPRIKLEQHEYKILANGTLGILNQAGEYIRHVQDFEKAGNNSMLVCLSSTPMQKDNEKLNHTFQFDETEAYVSLLLLCSSIACLCAVLATYTLFPQLRNLPGCNTMNLALSLLAMQIVFLLGQREKVTGTWCVVSSQILHYSILSTLMWMNVMAFDLYKTFGNATGLRSIRSKRTFLPRYIVYAYGSPAVIIGITNLFDAYAPTWKIAPHYGWVDVCWITSKYGAVTFFVVPLGLVVVTNFFFYVQTILGIRRVKHLVSLRADEKHCRRGKNDVSLYARMALVTGLTWALFFVAAYTRKEKIVYEILKYLFIIFNTLQGVYIFVAFVCNRTVLALYGELIQRNILCKETQDRKYKELFRKVANGMSRSVSTDTTVSTVSNLSSSSVCKDLIGKSS